MTRNTYTVHAKRWEHGWELAIAGPAGYEGASQAHGLKSAERMARDYIALDLEVPEDSFDVEIVPEVGGYLGELVKDVKTALHRLSEISAEASDKSRRTIGKLHDDGMTQTEIARVLGMSQQRVSQILEARTRGSKSGKKRSVAAGSTRK